jgi:hypothetical protein
VTTQEDCPICKQIAEGKIEKESKLCYLIRIGSLSVAVQKSHEDKVTPQVFAEAAGLLGFKGKGGSILADYDEVPGHWGLKLVRTSIPEGKSESKSE